MNTIIHNYSPPDDCLTCPFLKIIVANAGHGSSLKCLAVNAEVDLNKAIDSNARAPFCPMEIIE